MGMAFTSLWALGHPYIYMRTYCILSLSHCSYWRIVVHVIQGFQRGSKPQRAWSPEAVWLWPAELGVMWALCVGQSQHSAWLLHSAPHGPFHGDGCERHHTAAEGGQCKLFAGALRKCRPATSRASLGSCAADY